MEPNTYWRIIWRWTSTDIKAMLSAISDSPTPVVHVCSGASSIGDVRIDARYVVVDKESRPDRFNYDYTGSASIVADMYQLPLRSGVAGTIICDPPYTNETRDGVLIHELVRVLKPGGTLIFYAPWVPRHELLEITSIKAMPISKKSNVCKLFTIYHKVQASLFDYES